jgi:type III secretory pathway component EscU
MYSSLSLIIQVAFLFNKDAYIFLSFISNILFGIFIISMLSQIEKFPLSYFEQPLENKKRSYLLDFLRYFIFIIILTNFIFIGTITVHEVGHLLTSRTLGCEFGKIIYEQGFPHTEILCNDSFNSLTKVILGGILLPILIAILLYFAGGTFIRELSLLIIGFNLIISYQDILDIGISKNISIFSSIIGGVLILASIGLLAKSRTSEEEFMQSW